MNILRFSQFIKQIILPFCGVIQKRTRTRSQGPDKSVESVRGHSHTDRKYRRVSPSTQETNCMRLSRRSSNLQTERPGRPAVFILPKQNLIVAAWRLIAQEEKSWAIKPKGRVTFLKICWRRLFPLSHTSFLALSTEKNNSKLLHHNNCQGDFGHNLLNSGDQIILQSKNTSIDHTTSK